MIIRLKYYFNCLFSFTINEVQDKNEYIWRYQRYELIREYFEKPLFAFPPLSLLAYIAWFIKIIRFRSAAFRIFSEYNNENHSYHYYLQTISSPESRYHTFPTYRK